MCKKDSKILDACMCVMYTSKWMLCLEHASIYDCINVCI